MGSEIKLWIGKNGKLYSPTEDEELQLRIIVPAHSAHHVHRGCTNTCQISKNKWNGNHGRGFKRIHARMTCVLTFSKWSLSSSSTRIKMRAHKFKDLLHFGYLYIKEFVNNKDYILVLRNNFSGFCFLRYCACADPGITAEVLIVHFTIFALV